MILILLFYLLGVIISSIIAYKLIVKGSDYTTIIDIISFIIFSISSWTAIIIYIIENYNEIINYKIPIKHKSKNNL